MVIERGNTIPLSVDKSVWKRVWTYPKIDYTMKKYGFIHTHWETE
jgi:hypothetical protein